MRGAGASGSVAHSGVAQVGQNTWARRRPLAATLMYWPVSPCTVMPSGWAATTARNGAPDITWQSVQWQAITRAGSIRAAKRTWPQWQAPSMVCMARVPRAGSAPHDSRSDARAPRHNTGGVPRLVRRAALQSVRAAVPSGPAVPATTIAGRRTAP